MRPKIAFHAARVVLNGAKQEVLVGVSGCKSALQFFFVSKCRVKLLKTIVKVP